MPSSGDIASGRRVQQEVDELEKRLIDARRRLRDARGQNPAAAAPGPILTSTEQQLAAALSAADGGSWEWDPETDRIALSDACWEMMGHEPGQLDPTAAAWVERLHPDDRSGFATVLGRCIDGSQNSYREVVRFRTRDGGHRHLLTSGRVHDRDAAGRATGIVGILLDVEPIHHLQRRYEEQNRQLSRRVAELAARNEELDRFTHVASHDLRSPLRSILGFASHLEWELDADSQQAGHVRRIARAGRRMTDLLDALLAYAGAGRGPQNFKRVDLNRVVLAALEDLHEARHPGVVCLGTLPEVYGDPVLLQTVFQNLLGNAFKYAGEQPARIEVAEASGDAAPGRVRVRVSDAGEGFDPAHAARLFEPFERMSGSGVSGSGVGLSIVRRVVESHGGRAWADLGEGPLPTRFWLELPTGPPTEAEAVDQQPHNGCCGSSYDGSSFSGGGGHTGRSGAGDDSTGSAGTCRTRQEAA